MSDLHEELLMEATQQVRQGIMREVAAALERAISNVSVGLDESDIEAWAQADGREDVTHTHVARALVEAEIQLARLDRVVDRARRALPQATQDALAQAHRRAVYLEKWRAHGFDHYAMRDAARAAQGSETTE